VSEAGRLGAGDLVGSLGGSGTLEIKSREQGIFQNVTDPAELRDQNVNVLAIGNSCGFVEPLEATAVATRPGTSASLRVEAACAAAEPCRSRPAALAEGRSSTRGIRAAVAGLIGDMRNMSPKG
jgi:hypothetical protein